MTWQRGADRVRQLVADGRLEVVSGAAADGSELLASAQGLLLSSHREHDVNPEAAFILAYDAARKACASLLAQQGLRTKSAGHHVTTEEVVRAQFGGPFDEFGGLRRRRVEIEYPRHPGDVVTLDEMSDAYVAAASIVDAASALLPTLSLFRA